MTEVILKAYRASGMNRLQLAKRSGVPYSTIHIYFAKGRDIKLSNVQRLCDALGLELTPRKDVQG